MSRRGCGSWVRFSATLPRVRPLHRSHRGARLSSPGENDEEPLPAGSRPAERGCSIGPCVTGRGCYGITTSCGSDQALSSRQRTCAIELIRQKRGRRYAWPGNFRELERTVRRIHVHDQDAHASPSTQNPAKKSDAAATALGRAILEGRMRMDEIERVAIVSMYRKTKSRREGARRLGIDRERFSEKLKEALGGAGPERDSTTPEK